MFSRILNLIRGKHLGQTDPIHSALERLKAKTTPFKFLQVGSSDGDLNDPLRQYIESKNAIGIFVEPLASSLDKIRERYVGFGGLAFINCAVDSIPGQRTLYQISNDDSSLPEWAYQVASFDRQVLLNHAHAIKDVAARITETVVPCRTIECILLEHSVDALDCMQIDTEGHDYEILKTFPFKALKPKLVIYEHKHLSPADFSSSKEFLINHGYRIIAGHNDVVASFVKR